jgi:hypothetical protein
MKEFFLQYPQLVIPAVMLLIGNLPLIFLQIQKRLNIINLQKKLSNTPKDVELLKRRIARSENRRAASVLHKKARIKRA